MLLQRSRRLSTAFCAARPFARPLISSARRHASSGGASSDPGAAVQRLGLPDSASKRVLLHSCCAPCSGAMVQEMVEAGHDISIFFYNPNIHPKREYEIRKEENKRYAADLGIPFVDADYDTEEWYRRARGMEFDPERGGRCSMVRARARARARDRARARARARVRDGASVGSVRVTLALALTRARALTRTLPSASTCGWSGRLCTRTSTASTASPRPTRRRAGRTSSRPARTRTQAQQQARSHPSPLASPHLALTLALTLARASHAHATRLAHLCAPAGQQLGAEGGGAVRLPALLLYATRGSNPGRAD